jgi:hypothetical protein
MTRGTLTVVACVCAVLKSAPSLALAPIDYRDTLDKAVLGPTVDSMFENLFDPYVGYQHEYDNNLYRLPSAVTDLATLTGIGPHPRRYDDINSVTTGVDAQWQLGTRQSFDLALRADDNLYTYNTNLNNLSTDDSATWNWGMGSVFTGEVGVHYMRQLASFVNSDLYSRDILNHSEYFAGARYQAGPHWVIFAGALDALYSLSSRQSNGNNTRINEVEIGTELAGDGTNSLGVDYRYTDAHALSDIAIDTVIFHPDYHEESARVLVKYVLSDKSTLDANAGYLRRSYPDSPLVTFSGYIGRINFQWQLSDKTQLVVRAYRQLAADITAETDYFIATGGSIGPTWTLSEKFAIALTGAYDHRNYLGFTPGLNVVPGRRDNLPSESAIFTYNPITALTITGAYSHEHRASNQQEFLYDDDRASVSAFFKF